MKAFRITAALIAGAWAFVAPELTPVAPDGWQIGAPRAAAQDAEDEDRDKGLIVNFLEDNLSGEDRSVIINGFSGALSSTVRMDELIISDADGAWLTLRGAVLDWNRSALLRGRVEVEELSAEEIIMPRLPLPAEEPVETSDAQASGFSLPELPVSIRIDKLAIERAEIGEPVIGQDVVATLAGSMRLANGEGEADLDLRRTDGRTGIFSVQGAYSNASDALTIDVALEEDPGGIVASLAGIPDEPSVVARIQGDGPLDDFNATIDLQTDGEERLAGSVELRGQTGGGREFSVDIGGDVTPLFLPQYQDFFGEDVQLTARGATGPDGGVDLERFALTARRLDIAGALVIGGDGLPRSFNIEGAIEDTSGDPVVLPVSGDPLQIQNARLRAQFDAENGDAWEASITTTDVVRGDVSIARLALDGTGTIQADTTEESPRGVTADFRFAATGVDLPDAELSAALGADLGGTAQISWQEDAPLVLESLTLGGEDLTLSATGQARIADRSVALEGSASFEANNLARYAPLIGQPLEGAVRADLEGSGDVLGGIFDLALDVTAQDLAVGIAQLDPLLDGETTLVGRVSRDETGLRIDTIDLRNPDVTLAASGLVAPGQSDVTLDARLAEIGEVLEQYSGPVTLKGTAREVGENAFDVALDLTGPYDLEARVEGRIAPEDVDVVLAASLPDIAPLLPDQDYSGPVAVDGRVTQLTASRFDVDLAVDGPYSTSARVDGEVEIGASDVQITLSVPDIAPLLPQYGYSGPLTAEGRVQERGDGSLDVDLDLTGPYNSTASVDGVVLGGATDIEAQLAVPDISPVVPGYAGPLQAAGTIRELDGGRFAVDLDASGPYGANASVEGVVLGGATDVEAQVYLPDIAPLAPGFSGPLRAAGTIRELDGGQYQVDLDATGPYGSEASVAGVVLGGATDVQARLSVPNIAPFAPGLSGPLTVAGDVREETAGLWDVDLDLTGPYGARGAVDGVVGSGASDVAIELSLPNISPFAPGLSGSLAVDGTVAEVSGGGWRVALDSRGPGSAQARVTGSMAQDFSTVDLDASGSVPLALVNRVLAPRSLAGTAQFDLSINGAPALGSVSGQVTTRGAQMSLPTLGQTLEDINVTVQLGGGRATIDAFARAMAGGRLYVDGPITLSDGYNADLTIRLGDLVLEDPNLYRTSLDGRLSLAGPLTGGAAISGTIDIGETEIRIPETGLSFSTDIPDITHLNEPAIVRATRARAGLIGDDSDGDGSGADGDGGSDGFALNVLIRAPNRIFIRGRGLDAELGGELRVTGTTSDIIPVGSFELVRGRLDLLGKRFTLDEGAVFLQGGLTPSIALSARTVNAGFTSTIGISGTASDPEISFTSEPDLPEDEVLARLFFGQSIENLSPLQAAQLASAVATLAGQGSGGLLTELRENIGVDDLDVTADEDGNAALRVGKYISDNIYTDVTANSQGETTINLNIDLTDTVTVRGGAGSNGETSLGIFFERDY